MPIQVVEAQDEDMDRVFEICSLAFAHNEPIWDVMWPKHWEEGGRKQGAERMRATKNTDVNTKYMIAKDSETGAIMGMSKWNLYANNTLPDMDAIKNMPNYWNDDEEFAYATTMTGVYLEERNAAIRKSGGNIVSLDILAIDPAYQRRGLGGALVKWGTEKADELGFEAVVESSPFGKGLYQKNGYEFIRYVKLRGPGKWGDREAGGFVWMVRPKKQH